MMSFQSSIMLERRHDATRPEFSTGCMIEIAARQNPSPGRNPNRRASRFYGPRIDFVILALLFQEVEFRNGTL